MNDEDKALKKEWQDRIKEKVKQHKKSINDTLLNLQSDYDILMSNEQIEGAEALLDIINHYKILKEKYKNE